MQELKILWGYMLENKLVSAAAAGGMPVGAWLGVLAYYNGWLG